MERTSDKPFNRVNWIGIITLIGRERKRFTTVWSQTLLAPIITSGLFIFIFSVVLSQRVETIGVSDYTVFIAPGIVMMMVMQNSFANTVSSLLISKIQGNIVDTLMPPLNALEIVTGLMMGGVLRGLLVSLAIIAAIFPYVGLLPEKFIFFGLFILLGGIQLSLIGILAGIISTKFDHMAAITNFVITPLSFLSGTFYSIEILPKTFEVVSSYNPIFLLIDGARYGALGASYNHPLFNVSLSLLFSMILFIICWRFFSVGYKLKS